MNPQIFNLGADAPIIIKNNQLQSGIEQQEVFLSNLFGRKGTDWRRLHDEISILNGRFLDTVYLWTRKGHCSARFDITDFRR